MNNDEIIEFKGMHLLVHESRIQINSHGYNQVSLQCVDVSNNEQYTCVLSSNKSLDKRLLLS